MSDTASRISLLRRLALACAVLVLAIASLTAYIRLSRAGLGCEPWPQCYAQRATLPPAALAQWDDGGVAAARMAHRVTAGAVTLLVIALLLTSLGGQPMLWAQGRVALGLLGLALFLAVLGRMGADSRAAPVVLGNLLGGLSMFALSCRMVQVAGPRKATPADARLRPWVIAGLALLVLELALGGLVSSTHAGLQCGERPLCAAHRFAGMGLAAYLLAVGMAAWRAGRRLGALLAVLLLGQVALGWLLLAYALPLALAIAHNGVAALLLATLLALLRPR